MTPTRLTCTPVPHQGIFSNPHWEKCIRDLSKDPNSGAPFCISFDLWGIGHNIRFVRTIKIWKTEDHLHGRRAVSNYFGDTSPDETRTFGVQAFNILVFEQLLDAVDTMLHNMFEALPKGAHGNRYQVCICPHGVVILCEDIHRNLSFYGPDKVVLAMTPDASSNHQNLRIHKGIADCANALIPKLHPYGNPRNTFHVEIVA